MASTPLIPTMGSGAQPSASPVDTSVPTTNPQSVVTLKDGTQLDGGVVKVMRAIRQVESGGDFNAKGDNGTSLGAYQWNNLVDGKHVPLTSGQLPANFVAAANRFGLDPTDFSPANQNKVAYAQIADYKSRGLTPNSIDALWNGAKPDPNNLGQYIHIASSRLSRFQSALSDESVSTLPVPTSTPTTSKNNQNSGGGILDTLARGAFSLFRGATQPVATLLARPFQAAAELAGASPEQVNAFSAKVPIFGEGGALNVPQNGSDVLKDVGRAGETAALGLAPVAGGALFGLGSSVEQGNSPLSLNAAAQTAAGAVGGKVLDVAAPFIAKGAAAATPLVVKNAFGAVASKVAPLARAAGDFAANTRVLPQAASDAINSAAGAVNAAPGGALDALRRQYGGTAGAAPDQIRSAALADVTKALGSTGQKSAGVFSGQSERLLKGLETLHDLAPGLKVSDELGNEIPYDPTIATLPQHVQALDSAKKQVYSALEKNITGATKSGVQVDLQPTIDHLTAILESPGKVAQHARASALLEQLQKLKASGEKPSDVNEFLQDLNVGLKGLFSSGQASVERQVDSGVTRTLNDSLDRTVLDLKSGSRPIRDLKNKYSNLKSIEKGLVSKAQFIQRRIGNGLADYINPFNLADALEVLHSPLTAAKGAFRASLLFKEKLKRDPERLLNDVFSGIAAYRGGGVPRPPRTAFGRPTAIPAVVGGAIKGAFGGQPLSTPGQ